MEREIVLILLTIIELALIYAVIKYGNELEKRFTFKKFIK